MSRGWARGPFGLGALTVVVVAAAAKEQPALTVVVMVTTAGGVGTATVGVAVVAGELMVVAAVEVVAGPGVGAAAADPVMAVAEATMDDEPWAMLRAPETRGGPGTGYVAIDV